MRNTNRIAHFLLATGLLAGFAAWAPIAPPAKASIGPLTWVAPTTTASLRIGRRPENSQAGADGVDSGPVSKFCSSTVSTPGGNQLSCKLEGADTTYQYFVCSRDQNGENLGGFECSFHGNGGGWECAPADIAASWCD